MHWYLKPVSISHVSIELLKIPPFLEVVQQKFNSSSQFVSTIAVRSQNLDYSSSEEKQNLVPPRKICPSDSTKVCNNLYNLRTNPSVAFAYFKDSENRGFYHDISTYASKVSILFNSNQKSNLVSLFSNLISLNTNTCFYISSSFFSLLQSIGGSSLVSFTIDALLKAYRTSKRAPQEAVNVFFSLGKQGFFPDTSSCNFLLKFIANSGDARTLISVFDQMRTFSINLDTCSFRILIKFFLDAKQPGKAVQYFGLMELAGIKPNRSIYLTCLCSMCACERYDLSYAVLQAMVREGMQIRPSDFNMVINGFCKESRLEEAEKLLQLMSKQNVPPDHYTYGCLIGAYCEKGNLLKALDLYEEMASRDIGPTPIIVANLLQCFRKLGMNGEVLVYFKKFKESGMELDNVLYGIAIDVHCRLGLMNEAVGLIQDMRINGLDLDTMTYTSLIAGFCHKREVDNAQKVLAEMLKCGLKPDLVTYNVLLGGFCRKGLVNAVFDLLEQMSVQGIEPSIDTYCLVIEGLSKGNRVGEAEVMFKAVEKHYTMDPMSRTCLFSSMVRGYLCQGFTARAYELFQSFSQQGNLIDKMLCGQLVRELCNEGNVGSACNVVNVMFREQQVVLDEFSYGKLITAFCQKGDLSGAHFWFEDMLKNGVHLNVFLCTSLMNGYCRVGRLHDACELFVKMIRAGIKPDVVSYTVLLDGHLKEVLNRIWLESAKEKAIFELKAKLHQLAQGMVNNEIEPDVICYTVLIDGQCKMEYLNHAQQLFDEMVGKGLVPDVPAYTALINGYCSQGKIEKAQSLFQEMVDSGLRPDPIAFSVLNKVILRGREMQREFLLRI